MDKNQEPICKFFSNPWSAAYALVKQPAYNTGVYLRFVESKLIYTKIKKSVAAAYWNASSPAAIYWIEEGYTRLFTMLSTTPAGVMSIRP